MDVGIHFTSETIVIPPAEWPSREIGAALEFHGIVRELEHGSAVPGLFYEAYEPMARKVLHAHLTELGARHPIAAVLFIHRLGWVPVGEASLYLRVLSAHRWEGLAFLGASIDLLKKDVPIWKRAAAPKG